MNQIFGSIERQLKKLHRGIQLLSNLEHEDDMQGGGVALNKNIIITSQYPTTWDSVILNNGPHFWISGDPNSMNRENTQLIGMTLQNGNLNKNGAGDPAGGSVSVYNGVTVTFKKILFQK